MTHLPQRCDVVVVGAGLAGLAAAVDLSAAGVDVLLLDAADAVGGRVRTDTVDGFLVDRGFQVLNTAYPAVRRYLDRDALELRTFPKGIAVRTELGLHRIEASPSGALAALAFLAGPVVGPVQALRLLRVTARNAGLPAASLKNRPETTAEEALRADGLNDRTLDRLVRPFLSGVLLEDRLDTSSRFADLIWRSFVRGAVTVPSAGMRAIPEQMAARLDPAAVRLQTAVRGVEPEAVHTAEGTTRCRAVLVATGPAEAHRLLPALPAPPMRAVTTYYHSRPAVADENALLHVDGRARGARRPRVANTVVLTATAPSYSPAGRALVATSVLGAEHTAEREVRTELAALYGTSTDGWEHVSTVRVPEALPAARPPLGDLRGPVELGDGLFVAGDHRDTPSLQGALASGGRAASAVLRALGARNG